MKKLLLVSTALFLLIAGPAHAGPIVGGLGLLIGGLTGAMTATQVVLGIVSLGAQWLISQMMKPKEKQRGVKTKMETGGDKPPAFIIGEYATAGALDYVNVWDGGDIPNQYLVYVIVVSALPADSISNYVYINGERCTALWGAQDADGFSYVDEYEKNDTHYVRLKFYDGTQTGADPWLMEKFGDDPDRPWKNDMHLDGCAYVIAVCSFSNMGVWTGNPEFRWVVRGCKTYDPRKDSTVGGSGPQRWDDKSTWTFTKNAKVNEYNIIRGFRYRNEMVWGGGAEAYRLPLDYWFAAMNVCDENVEKKNGDVINRYEIGGEIHFDDQPMEIIDEINKATCGYTTEYGGIYKTWCGGPGLSIATITDDDFLISAELETNRGQALNSIYNTAYATYPEPKQQWEQKDGPQFQDADALAEDGQELAIDMQLPLVIENNQVQRIMRATVLDSRRQVTHAGQLPPEAFVFEPHDRISFVSQTFGYHGDGKDFLIASKEDLSNVNQQVLLREINPGDTGWLKENELDYSVGPLRVVKAGKLDLDFTLTADQIDSTGGKDKPAILCQWNWAAIDIDVQNIKFEIRRAGTTKVIAEGRIRNPQDGSRTFTNTVFRFGRTYELRLKPEPFSNRDSSWTNWKSIKLIDLDIPLAPSLVPVSDLADDGSQVYFLKIDWPDVAAEVEYAVRIVVDGDTRFYRCPESHYKISAVSSKAYTVAVRAIGADGGTKGDWSLTATQTVSKKNTNNTPPNALTVVGKFGKNIVRLGRPSTMKDFGKFNIYAAPSNDFSLASLVDDTPASRFEHGELGNGVARYYWATTVDRTGNESGKFPTGNFGGIPGTTLSITDGDNDPTPPGPIASAPSLSQLTADIDKDKTIDTGLQIDWNAPASGRAAKRYFVEVYRRKGDKGTDGNNVTGYTLWKDFYTNRVSRKIKANANFFHKARVTPVSANEVEGTPSAFTSEGVQPLQYLSTIPRPNAPAVTPKGNGFFIKAQKAAFDNFQETIFYADGVEIERKRGNTFNDQTARSVNDSVVYTVQYVDNQDRVGLVSLPTTVSYRLIQAGDINDGAIGTAKVAGGAITVEKTDQTAPSKPAAPLAMTGLTADIDKDGEIDKGFYANIPLQGGTPVKTWEIELMQAAAQGASGSMTGYAKKGANKTAKAEQAAVTYVEIEGKQNKWYKTRYRGISFNGVEGPWSDYQALGAQPGAYNAMAGVNMASLGAPTVVAIANGFVISWNIPTDPTYDKTAVLANGAELERVGGKSYQDMTTRALNSTVTYTVIHYDRAGNPTAASPAKVSPAYRQTQSTEIADSAVIASKIQTGILDASKFAANIAPVEIFAALPTTGNYEGRQVYLSTDKKLYRYTGSAWTSAVAAADVGNGLTSAQIADLDAAKLTGTIVAARIGQASLDATKFANSIKPVEIVAALPATGNVDGRLAFLTTDKKLYRYNGATSAWTKEVDGADIKANSITAGQIQAAAIGATEIAANAITAKHLLLMDTENLVQDFNFEQGVYADVWDFSHAVSPYFWLWTGDAQTGKQCLILDNLVTGGTGIQLWMQSKSFVPVTAGASLAWEISRRTNDGSGSANGLYYRIYWFDRADAALSATPFTDVVAGGSIPVAWTVSRGQVAVPAGATYAKIRIYHNVNSGTRYLMLDRVSLRKAEGASLIVDGSITTQHMTANTINGDRITGNTLSGDKIIANTITAKQLLLTDFSNIADNGWSQGVLDGWSLQNQVNWLNDPGGDWAGWRLETKGRDQLSQMIAVSPGDPFYFDVWVYNADTTRASVLLHTTTPNGATHAWAAAAFTDLKNQWVNLTGQAVVPAGHTFAQMSLHSERTAGVGSSTYWTKPVMRRAANAELIVDGSITTNKMSAGTIDADRLSAGSIAAGQIGAGAIVASKIAVGTFSDNLILDGDFESGLIDMWSGGGATFTNVVDATAPQGSRALKFDRGVTNNTVSMNRVWNNYIPVEEGDTYYAEFTIKGSTASAQGAYLRLLFYDASKTIIPGTGEVGYHDYYGNGPLTTSYVTRSGSYVIPAGVKYVRLQIYHHSSSTAQSLFVSGIMFKKSITGDLIVNGSITANKLSVLNLAAVSATLGAVDISSAIVGNLQVTTANITDDAILPSKFYQRDTTNQIRDSELAQPSLWTIGTSGADPGVRTLTQSVNPTADNRGFSRYKLRAYSTGLDVLITSANDITVEPGRDYYIGAFVQPIDNVFLIQMDVLWFAVNATGGYVQVGSNNFTNDVNPSPAGQIYRIAATAPAGATRAQIRIGAGTVNNQAGLGFYFSSPVFKAMTDTYLLAVRSVTTAKINDGAVTLAKMDVNSVDTAQLKANSVTSTQLAATSVNTVHLVDGAVQLAKLASSVFANGISAMALGSVGTYAFLKKTNTGTNVPGDTVSGSNLVYTDTGLSAGSSPAGTWMCMGRCPSGQSTTWLRVS